MAWLFVIVYYYYGDRVLYTRAKHSRTMQSTWSTVLVFLGNQGGRLQVACKVPIAVGRMCIACPAKSACQSEVRSLSNTLVECLRNANTTYRLACFGLRPAHARTQVALLAGFVVLCLSRVFLPEALGCAAPTSPVGSPATAMNGKCLAR